MIIVLAIVYLMGVATGFGLTWIVNYIRHKTEQIPPSARKFGE